MRAPSQAVSERLTQPFARALRPEDARQVADMELAVYPPGLVCGLDWVEAILHRHAQLEAPARGLCFFVDQQEECVGYTLMLPARSSFCAEERVAYAFDLAIAPAARSLSTLLGALSLMMDAVERSGLPALEADLRPGSTARLLQSGWLDRWLDARGLRARRGVDVPNPTGFANFVAVRFERAAGPA